MRLPSRGVTTFAVALVVAAIWDARISRYVKRAVLGEILQYGTGHYRTANGLVDSWMRSPPHRRVILAPDLRRIGLGIIVGTYRGQHGVAMATGDLSSTR